MRTPSGPAGAERPEHAFRDARALTTGKAVRPVYAPGWRSQVRCLAALPAPSKQPALRLRITPTGAKTWSISTRVAGRRRRFTVGQYPAISLVDARERAGKLLAEVRDGRDPVEEARAKRESALAPQATSMAVVHMTLRSVYRATTQKTTKGTRRTTLVL